MNSIFEFWVVFISFSVITHWSSLINFQGSLGLKFVNNVFFIMKLNLICRDKNKTTLQENKKIQTNTCIK